MPRSAIRKLVAGSRILPILDGLDELPEPARASVIAALNRSLGEDDQLIITSRTAELSAAVDAANSVVNSGLVLEAQPLRPDIAAHYLRSCVRDLGPGWADVLADTDTALAAVARTPWGLWLLRTVYSTPGADLTRLAALCRAADPTDLRAHLMEAIVPAVITDRTPSAHTSDDAGPEEGLRPRRRRDPGKTSDHLAFLADLVSRRTTADTVPPSADIQWWHLGRLAGGPSRTFRVTVGVLVTVLSAAAIAIPAAMMYGVANAVLGGLVFGVGTGWAAGMSVDRACETDPGYLRKNLREDLPALARAVGRRLFTSSHWGLFAVGIPLAAGFRPSPVVLVLPALAWCSYGITSGFETWAEAPATTDEPSSPRDHLRADLRLNITRMIMYAVVYGICVLVLVSILKGIPAGLLFGAIMAVCAAISTGMLGGSHRASLGYAVTVGHLARRGLVPRDLMPFLDDMHRLGLLRAVGPTYQFRHVELREHFAARYRRRCPAGVDPAGGQTD